MTRFLYRLLRTNNDLRAVYHGPRAVVRRAGRRVYGKTTGRLARKLLG